MHALYVFGLEIPCTSTVDSSWSYLQLEEKGAYQVLDSKLQKLAATHVNAGVTD
jgi:hypothetical protein